MSTALLSLAEDVDRAARQSQARIVLAESCTAGRVAQTLALIPGVSDWFCGSAVVYRNATKTAWLGVDDGLLSDPMLGPVCAETAAAMCSGVLACSPEATLAAAVTGHLGPNSPAHLDGRIYIGVQRRRGAGPILPAHVTMQVLSGAVPTESSGESLRAARQCEAARLVLQSLYEFLTVDPADDPSCRTRNT